VYESECDGIDGIDGIGGIGGSDWQVMKRAAVETGQAKRSR
jgi:hypothetical protein